MNNALQLFNFKEQEIRVVIVNGEPWWVAVDVCRVLEITRTDSALRALDEDEKGTHSVSTLGGDQKMSCVTESGLYHLVFISRKKEAKEFRRWVTEKVIPAIRKTGSYSVVPTQLTEEQIFTKDVQRRCIINEKLLPRGYWCVVTEMWREAWTLEAFQKELKPSSLPDGSCGAMWRSHLKSISHPLFSKSKREYLHVPNLTNRVKVYVYPDELLSEFRTWIRAEYADYYVASYSPSRLVGATQIEAPKRKRLK